MPKPISSLHVRRAVGPAHRGKLLLGGRAVPCAIGRAGIVAAKREGDGGTPRGAFRLIALWRRPDRRPARCALPTIAMRRTDGWCDDPGHRLYNRPVKLPFSASHERMWRSDGLYDLVVDIAWNRGPVVRGLGSAIFIHAARPDFSPTAGCVALTPGTLRKVLAVVARRCTIDVR